MRVLAIVLVQLVVAVVWLAIGIAVGKRVARWAREDFDVPRRGVDSFDVPPAKPATGPIIPVFPADHQPEAPLATSPGRCGDPNCGGAA